jgi:glycosyltransferase involved in cell wall biosynthesis
MAAVCDHVLAGNQFLADKAKGFNQAVTIVPTCIDISRYAADFSKPADSIDLVWIGSSSTRKYLVEALPALRRAAALVPGLRLKIIADFDLPDAGLPVLAVPWDAATEARELGSAHIGIAPMVENDWTRGKCALKVLQYMAAGLPVVSSAAGANAEIVLDGETGFLAGDDAAWAERIGMLAGSPEMRDRMGMAGRRRATADYSIEPVFSRMLGAFAALS